MRFVNKTSVTKPEEFDHTNTTFINKTLKTFPQIVKGKEIKKIDNDYYNKSLSHLEKLYANNHSKNIDGQIIFIPKCAFCESKDNGTSKFEIEHYRPKKEVTEDKNHNGYYWLAYEWTNLLISCPYCNRGTNAKHNKFPIIGNRIYSENYLINKHFDIDSFNLEKLQELEQPLLLHPEIDNPISHLIFKNNGKILGISQRGRATIRICNLNRSLLKSRRWKKIKTVHKSLKLLIEDYLVKKITPEYFKNQLKSIFEKIKNSEQGHKEFTLLGKNMFERFEYFFILQFENDKIKNILTELFNRYKNNTL
ncbi:MAG: hypothetical protein EAZ97_13135 [Bacteroidetes bacterium]|nr:MAG: hypothetical protein EAZ97_13135 [Bacteroidota bacterium]